MGKKSRGKKNKKGWVRKAPDEIISSGPIQIERYGRHIRFSNNMTPEQHADFLVRLKESSQQILADIEAELSALQELVGKYDAVELLHRAAYMLLPLFMKYRSEGEFESDEACFLPTVEYLQYLVARTERNADGRIPNENEWGEIWGQALKVMRLTQSYLMARGTLTNPPTEIDELRFMLDNRRLMIRVKRYPCFFADQLRSALSPYEQQIIEIYQVGVEELVVGLSKIDEYQRTGVIGRYKDLRAFGEAFSEELRAQGYAVDPGATPEEIARTQAAFETDEFKTMYEEVQEKTRLALTPAIFEITDITALPKPFLSFLSVRPGESVLKTLTGPAPSYDDLSPLSTSVLHHKPFLEVDGKFYTFYHSGFEDHIAHIIETDLFEKRPGKVSEMAKRRSNRLESDANDLLSSIIRPDFAFKNAYYPNPDDVGNVTELDILMGVGDLLILVEAKAGGFSASASRGAPKSMEQEFSDLIIEGQRQSERAERYIKSADEVAFFDESGKSEIYRVRHAKFRRIFRIVITREDLGWVGAKIAVLSVLDPSLNKSYPWHVSIDDLRVVADLFQNDEIRFVHYLETRLLASAETVLSQHDEIEHVGLYNSINYYHELPVQGMDRMSFDPSYMRDIDHYFMDKSAGESSPIPTQDILPKIRELISALRSSGLPQRFEVGSIILSMNADGRHEFQQGLDVVDAGRAQGRQRTLRLPFTGMKYGLTISYADDSNWPEELKNSAVQMEYGSCDRWLVVQLTNKAKYEIAKIEVIEPGQFSDSDLASARSRHEKNAQEKMTARPPGRNETCPCGSGKKFKRCHGL